MILSKCYLFLSVLILECLIVFGSAHAQGSVPGTWVKQALLTDAQKRLFRKYADALSCLPNDEQKKETPDWENFNWQSLKNDDHALVCVYRMAEELQTPAAMVGWFESFGFKSSGPWTSKGTVTTHVIDAYWSLDGQWPLYPGWISISRYISRMFYYSYSVQIHWLENGQLASAQIGYSAE